MKIDDVIRDAPSEGVVYFLLAAYIDAVWREGGAGGVHPVVAKLPLSGVDDVEARFNLLAAEVSRAGVPGPRGGEVIQASVAVFGAAAQRLRRLRGERDDGLGAPAPATALPTA